MRQNILSSDRNHNFSSLELLSTCQRSTIGNFCVRFLSEKGERLSIYRGANHKQRRPVFSRLWLQKRNQAAEQWQARFPHRAPASIRGRAIWAIAVRWFQPHDQFRQCGSISNKIKGRCFRRADAKRRRSLRQLLCWRLFNIAFNEKPDLHPSHLYCPAWDDRSSPA